MDRWDVPCWPPLLPRHQLKVSELVPLSWPTIFIVLNRFCNNILGLFQSYVLRNSTTYRFQNTTTLGTAYSVSSDNVFIIIIVVFQWVSLQIQRNYTLRCRTQLKCHAFQLRTHTFKICSLVTFMTLIWESVYILSQIQMDFYINNHQ
jgi:hypothetical protein